MSNQLLNESDLEDEIQSKTHSFIVKLWLEDLDRKSKKTVWRGHITHVQSGERRYFEKLDGVTLFMIPYMKITGVKLGFWWHVRQYLNRWK